MASDEPHEVFVAHSISFKKCGCAEGCPNVHLILFDEHDIPHATAKMTAEQWLAFMVHHEPIMYEFAGGKSVKLQ